MLFISFRWGIKLGRLVVSGQVLPRFQRRMSRHLCCKWEVEVENALELPGLVGIHKLESG